MRGRHLTDVGIDGYIILGKQAVLYTGLNWQEDTAHWWASVVKVMNTECEATENLVTAKRRRQI
jgi:hypothetical protein